MTIFNDCDKKDKIIDTLKDLNKELLNAASNNEYLEGYRAKYAEKIGEVTRLIMFVEEL